MAQHEKKFNPITEIEAAINPFLAWFPWPTDTVIQLATTVTVNETTGTFGAWLKVINPKRSVISQDVEMKGAYNVFMIAEKESVLIEQMEIWFPPKRVVLKSPITILPP